MSKTESTRNGIARRDFLKGTAAFAAAPLFVPNALRYTANEKLNVAIVGPRGQGTWHVNVLKSEHIVALCDVDADRLAEASVDVPDARTYRDFRRMLETEADAIDAVLVAAPDHIHAPASVMAMRMGKHVYCEKPLAHSVHEARVMRELARENGLATQMGTQIHAGSNYRRVVELVRGGAIGPVREAHVWCGKHWSRGRRGTPATPPAKLDWDLWLGPAPEEPYFEGVHPKDWRRFWTWGNGTLGDMGCHYLDIVFWALDLEAPTTVRALGPTVHPDGTPDPLIVHYDFPARGEAPPVRVTWYQGPERPSILSALRARGGAPFEWPGDGKLFVGDEGLLITDYNRHVLLPEEKFDGFEPPEPSIPDSIGHHAEWIAACKGAGRPLCNFGYAGPLTETVLLGNIAFRAGGMIEWDAERMTCPNAPEAERFLRRDYRAGWRL